MVYSYKYKTMYYYNNEFHIINQFITKMIKYISIHDHTKLIFYLIFVKDLVIFSGN